MSLPSADFDFDTDFNTDLRPRALPTAAAERLDACPWCDQPIPPEKLAEISGRMAAREHDLVSAAALRLRDEFSRERSLAEAKARSALEQVRREAALEAERGRQAALADARSKLLEAETVKRTMEREMDLLRTSQEAEVLRRVQEERAVFERDRAAVLAEQAKTFEERQKLQNKVQELQRQLEKKTEQEMGEGAQIDLYETLRTAFRGDRIIRQPRIKTFGADLVHEIVHNGKLCGKIVYDSKNRGGFWRHEYVLRLREDRIALRADHAVLSSNKFPGGAHQLHVQDGVIVACPARVLALAGLLRAHIVQLHELQISEEAREEKTTALYTFVTSERCRQLLGMIDSLTEKVLEVDLAEKKAHASVWDKRNRLLKAVLKAHGDLCFEIDRIIGAGAVCGAARPGPLPSEF